MYCRNCGAQMDPNAAVCIRCGYAAGTGKNYCPNCGNMTAPESMVCTYCGVVLPVSTQMPVAGNQKSKLAAGLLGILVGALGIHNFYLGYTGKGVAQLLLTLLSCGALGPVSAIWGLVEGIMILTGSISSDGKGLPLKE